MSIRKFTISRDDAVYECFPYICLTTSGRILLVYRESNGHVASEYCRVILRHSDDGGQSWSERRVLVDEDRSTGVLKAWNCPKIQQLEDGRILLLCDVYDFPPGEWGVEAKSEIVLLFSDDDGMAWSEPKTTSVRGICPDQVTEMPGGRWLLPTNIRVGNANQLTQILYVSQDQGATWDVGTPMNTDPDRELDEASIVRMPEGELVSYEREDLGRPLQKLISIDGGRTWGGPFDTLNPSAIGMPVAGLTQDGHVLITARFGLRSRWRVDEMLSARLAKRTIVIPKVEAGEANRRFVQNVGSGPHILETDDEIVIAAGGTSVHTYAFLEPVESALSPDLSGQKGLLLPLDVDASPFADSGYSSWVEVERGQFLCVNYINDDAPMAQIRGYRFGLEDF